MGVFLCVVALCTLLTPAQSGLAEIYLCKRSLAQTITELIDQLSPESLLPLSIEGGKQKGGRGLMSNLTVGNIVHRLGKTIGVKINEANLLEVDINMESYTFSLTVKIQLIDDITKLLNGIQRPLINSASGPTKLIAKLSNNIPFKWSVTKDNKLEISVDEQNCKLLKVNIVLKRGTLNGPLAAVKDQADTVTKSMRDTVGGILSDAVCKSVLPKVFSLLNQKLNLPGDTLPLGPLGQTLTYVINAVKGLVGDCLVIDVNVTSDGQLLDGLTAPSSCKNPTLDRDGAILTKPLLDKSIEIQMSFKRLNSILNRGGPTTLKFDEVSPLLQSDINEGINMTVTVTSRLETILKEGATPQLQTSARVAATGSETSTPAFDVTVDIWLNIVFNIEELSIKITVDVKGLDNIVQKSSTTFEESDLKPALTTAAKRVAASINACQLSIPRPVMLMDVKNTTMQVKEGAIAFVSIQK